MSDRSILFLVSICLCGCFWACTASWEYEQYAPVVGSGWDVNDTIRFTYQASNTGTEKDLYIKLRHEGTYPYSNLYVFLDVTNPHGYHLRDTIECVLADQRGQWLGKGFGSLTHHSILFKRKVRFPHQGEYVFSAVHGMRTSVLDGITEVGIGVQSAR